MRPHLSWITLFSAALLFAPHPGSAAAQEPAPTPFATAAPEAVGMSSSALSAAMDSIRGWVDQERILGAVLLVIRDDRVVFHEAAGWADRETRVPMRTDHIVQLRSMTKPLIGTAVLMLVEEGRLRLDDPVSQYLPSFDNERSREITIYQLLTHTSGLKGEIYRDVGGTPFRSLREAVDFVGEKGPEFEPGTDYFYSDTGSSTLGALIAEVSGVPAEEFIQRRILDPLGMGESIPQLSMSDARRARIASAYRRENGEWVRYWENSRPQIVPFFRASGGLYASALDYARFMRMMLHGGMGPDGRLLRQESVALATRPHSAYVYGADRLAQLSQFYGFHWSVFTDAHAPLTEPTSPGTFGHGGSDGTYAWADPDQRLIVVYLTQSRGNDTRPELMPLIYNAITR